MGVHICSPGMVATELLVRYADTPRKGAGQGKGWSAVEPQISVGLCDAATSLSVASKELGALHAGCSHLLRAHWHALSLMLSQAVSIVLGAARNINIIAEEPGEVAAWLVPRLRWVWVQDAGAEAGAEVGAGAAVGGRATTKRL